MRQSTLGSLIEASLNTLLGFMVAFIAWPIAGWLFSFTYSTPQHFGIVTFFTAISVLRGFLVRRFANHVIHNASENIAKTLLK